MSALRQRDIRGILLLSRDLSLYALDFFTPALARARALYLPNLIGRKHGQPIEDEHIGAGAWAIPRSSDTDAWADNILA